MEKSGTEQKILEAAKKVFISKGFTGARMQEIADEAEINKSMLHYYFRSKEQLFAKIMQNSVSVIIPKFIMVLSSNDSVINKFNRLVDEYIDTILEHPHIPMFLLNEISQNRTQYIDQAKLKMMENNTFQSFLSQIVEEQKKGLIKPTPPHHMMITVMSLIVFPFIAKPVFKNMLDISEEFYIQIITERKLIVKKILKEIIPA